MDQAIYQFICWQFIFACVAIGVITSSCRNFINYFIKKTETLKFFEDVFLPVMPVVIGAVAGYIIKGFPYPDAISTVAGRTIWGLSAGGISTTLYRFLTALIASKTPHADEVEKEPTDLIDTVRNSISKDQ